MALDLNDLLNNLPVDDLAKKFGVDSSVVQGAISQAVPGLLAGMANNASSEDGATKLQAAAQNHTGKYTSVDDLDVEDGKKIVTKVLGDNQGAVLQALGTNANNADVASLIPKLLPVIAPLLLQFLGNSTKDSSNGGGVTDLLGGLLGGGSSSSNSAGSVTDLIGGILGGGSSKGGGLGGLLGGLLGGGK